MPIYEYRCKECQQVFEEWCKHIEDKTVSHSCPICKGEAERLISNTSFALKGGGWYVTEYGSHKDKGEKAETKTAEPAAPAPVATPSTSAAAATPAPAPSQASS